MKKIYELIDRTKIYNVLPVLICFLLGRVRIFGFFSPLAFSASGCFGAGLGGICSLISFLGVLSRGNNLYIWKYLSISLALIFINSAMSKKFPDKAYSAGIAPALSVFIGGGLYGFVYGMTFYYIALNTIEALFAFFFTYIIYGGFEVITSGNLKKSLTYEEIISLVVILSCVICGLAGINIFGTDICVFVLSLFLVMTSYKFGSGAGAAMGAITAFLLTAQLREGAGLFAVLCLTGLFCGLAKGRSKGLCGSVFIISLFLTTLGFDRELLRTDNTVGAVLGATAFLVMPDRIYYRMTAPRMGVREPEEYIEQVCTIIENRLKGYSYSFKNLGAALSENESGGTMDIDEMTDEIGRIMCSDCSLKTFCWDKNFYVTCKAVYSMLMSLENEGIIDYSYIPDEFKHSCMTFTGFVNNVEKLWERERLNNIWKNKFEKSRELMKYYTETVAELLMGLSQTFRQELSYDSKLSLKLTDRLREEGIAVRNVSAGKTGGGRAEILVTLRSRDCTKQNTDHIAQVISGCIGSRIMKDNGITVYNRYGKELSTIRFIGENIFHVGVKIIREPKFGNTVSGDSHISSRMKDGSYLLALSDGMGSGVSARDESAASLDLFRDFISSGFSKEKSVGLINACMEFGSDSDSFATLDACLINLYSGDAFFIKTGACPTYLLRGGEAEIFAADSLPVGIVDKATPEISHCQLKKNDTLIMVTDGVIDSFSNSDRKEEELKKLIEDNKGISHYRLCEKIFEKVKENYRGKNSDDVTVLTARIY